MNRLDLTQFHVLGRFDGILDRRAGDQIIDIRSSLLSIIVSSDRSSPNQHVRGEKLIGQKGCDDIRRFACVRRNLCCRGSGRIKLCLECGSQYSNAKKIINQRADYHSRDQKTQGLRSRTVERDCRLLAMRLGCALKLSSEWLRNCQQSSKYMQLYQMSFSPIQRLRCPTDGRGY